MGRTVVLHPGALGDVLLAIPALRALRAVVPGDELVLAAQPRIGRLLAALGLVDRPVDFDTLGVETLFTEDGASGRLRELAGGARIVSWFAAGDPDFARRLRALAPGAALASPRSSGGTLVWRHLLSSVEALTGSVMDDDTWRDPAPPTRALIDLGRRELVAAGWTGTRPLVVLHPGAGSPAKCWGAEGFAALAAALADDADILVHEGPADRDAVADLRPRLRVPVLRVVDPSLEALAGVIGHAALWIGDDSGVSHLAAAVGAPALVLFAEQNLAWRSWSPVVRPRVVTPGAASRAEVESVTADAVAMLEAERPVAPSGVAR